MFRWLVVRLSMCTGSVPQMPDLGNDDDGEEEEPEDEGAPAVPTEEATTQAVMQQPAQDGPEPHVGV